MLARVEAYAIAPLPVLPRTDETHMVQFLRLMSTMPRQHSDELTGVLRVETMLRMLGHLPRVTIDWMADEALRRFTFHPSIKELLDLSKEWTRSDDSIRARSRAQRLAREERQARLDDARKLLRVTRRDPSWIEALPEQTARILEGDGLLWRCPDCGTYTQRGQWRDHATPIEPAEAMRAATERFPSSPQREAMEA